MAKKTKKVSFTKRVQKAARKATKTIKKFFKR
jgi:hypothetical protein